MDFKKDTREKICVALLGPRLHYALPRALSEANLLSRLYTDSYSGNKPVLRSVLSRIPRNVVPRQVRSWLGRTCPSIPREAVCSFEFFGILYAWRRARARTPLELTNVFSTVNAKFCRKVVSRGFGLSSAVVGFNSAALEIFKKAKSERRVCVLEQTILPRELEDRLLDDEFQRWGVPIDNNNGNAVDNPLSLRERAEWKMADHIIVGSKFVAAGLVEVGVPADKIHVIPYGVDKDIFRFRLRKHRTGRLKVLFVGEVGIRKGAGYLLEAISMLGSDCVEARFAGRIVLPPEVIKSYSGVAQFLGVVPRSEISGLYDWADVFVLPSIVEGSATVTYEAIMCGIPLVVTPNAGSILVHDFGGQIVPCSDSMSLAGALRLYIDDPDLWRRHAEEVSSLRDYAGVDRYKRDIVDLFGRIASSI